MPATESQNLNLIASLLQKSILKVSTTMQSLSSLVIGNGKGILRHSRTKHGWATHAPLKISIFPTLYWFSKHKNPTVAAFMANSNWMINFTCPLPTSGIMEYQGLLNILNEIQLTEHEDYRRWFCTSTNGYYCVMDF